MDSLDFLLLRPLQVFLKSLQKPCMWCTFISKDTCICHKKSVNLFILWEFPHFVQKDVKPSGVSPGWELLSNNGPRHAHVYTHAHLRLSHSSLFTTYLLNQQCHTTLSAKQLSNWPFLLSDISRTVQFLYSCSSTRINFTCSLLRGIRGDGGLQEDWCQKWPLK